jgi:DNA end-binding protein Ku
VVTVSIRTRMTTAVLRVRDDVIVMQTMLWPDEVRKPDFAGLDATEHAATANELKMAKLLVDTLAGDYDATEYDDDYAKAVEALVQAKLEGGEVKAPEQPKKSTGEVVDLLAALQRSVDAAKSSRGETPAEKPAEETSTKKAPAKKAAAKKAPAKKTAKKATTKKAAAKKAS